MKTRKKALKTMISLAGNAAAHRALYPENAFSIKEATLYELEAEELAEARSWNETEIETFREKSQRCARNEIKKRKYDYRGRKFEDLLGVAYREIEDFVEEELL